MQVDDLERRAKAMEERLQRLPQEVLACSGDDELPANVPAEEVGKAVRALEAQKSLLEERKKRGLEDVSILRIEQLYPFPQKTVTAILARSKTAEIVWCQEEPKNMGSWAFVRDYLEAAMAKAGMAEARPIYAGRPAAASPATGSMARHQREQAALVDAALAADCEKLAAE